MPALGTYKVTSVPDSAGTMTLTVRVTRRFTFRMWLGIRIIKLGLRLLPIHAELKTIDE